MPVDASIYSLIQQPKFASPMEAYGGALQLKNLVDQQALSELQRKQLMEADQENQRIRDLFGRGTAPTEADVFAASPKMGLTYQKTMLENKKTNSEIDKNKVAALKDTVGLYRDALGPVNDQMSFSLWRANLIKDVPQFAATVPEQFSPQTKMNLILKGDDFIKQAELALKTAEAPVVPDGQGGVKRNEPAIAVKKEIAQAGASNINVNTEKTFLGNLAEKVGQDVAAQAGAARDSVKTINSANQIRDALASGKVSAGPGTTLKMAGTQLASALGFSTDAEGLVQTRAAIQGLSKLALGARATLKGQGQISDFEGKTLAKAESGDIDSLSLPELKALADVADKGARLEIKRNNQNVERLRKNPNAKEIVNYLSVDEPPAYKGTAALAPRTVTALPDPVQHEGWTATDPQTGLTYKAIGGRWMRQ